MRCTKVAQVDFKVTLGAVSETVRQVRDYYRVQFRSGMFHIFEPPQFAFPHCSIGNPAAGVICFNRWNSAGHSVESAADFLTL